MMQGEVIKPSANGIHQDRLTVRDGIGAYWYQRPKAELTAIVRTVLVIEGFSKPTSSKVPLFTRGMPALVCRTFEDDGDRKVELTLHGQNVADEFWIIDSTTTVIAYFFKPFTLPCLFDLATAKLKNALMLENWHPVKTHSSEIRLLNSTSTAEKIAILDNLLMFEFGRAKKNIEAVSFATDHMLQSHDPDVLREIQERLKLTERSLQRLFKKYVGVTANHYRRICQFQLSFSQLRSKEFKSLADVAYDNGFSDQSHFIRSFKEFTAITPNDYLKTGLKKGE
jgi:AraC-like DNA-binding protein